MAVEVQQVGEPDRRPAGNQDEPWLGRPVRSRGRIGPRDRPEGMREELVGVFLDVMKDVKIVGFGGPDRLHALPIQ